MPIVLAVVAALAAGCGPVRLPLALTAPVMDPAAVIEAHNAWAESIQHIWARAHMKVNLPRTDTLTEPLQFDLDGHVFFQKPDDLFVHGEVLGQDVLRLGMNAERFWLWVKPKVNMVWTGRRNGPGERQFTLSPADLMTALGMFRIDLVPAQAARFEAQVRAYVLTEERRTAAGIFPVRRVWFDRQTLRPIRVDLYDEFGKRLLLAELMQYEKVDQTDVCTVYRARFYADEELDLVLMLTSVSLTKKVPAAVFQYGVPPGATVEDLDAGADYAASKKKEKE